jgi:Fe-S cluster biogenesis protein NfuA/nitrite reductase/ring-hydroxylating ferredoxin subunit
MQRIEELVHELERVDPAAQTAARELMSAVMELHGDALVRIVDAIGADVTRRLAADDVVRNVLLLYELHPDDVETRVRAALENVQPYIQSHGGKVGLSRIEQGRVFLHLDGSCGGCQSSSRTVKFAIEGAIFAAAPEIVEVIADAPHPPSGHLLPASGGAAEGGVRGWQTVGELKLNDGAGKMIAVSGRDLFFCREGESYYAWGSSCPSCGSALEGSMIEAGALRCARCDRRFDLRAAGRAQDDPALQLEPFPLLIEDGRARVAVPAA